jgi:hypothetical protein
MVKSANADRTIVVGASIFMVMKCARQNQEGKTAEED